MLAFAGAALLVTLLIIWQLVSYAQAAPAASQFPITVAIIALIGTLWTGAITFAGLLLKDSVDRRSALIQAESEKRLRMETALKAVELISRAEVEGAPMRESREAAIMVIASLNQLRLAFTLAEQFWNRDKISSEAFVEIVSLCLGSEDDNLKGDSCFALKNNHGKLLTGSNKLEFPKSFCINWNGNLPFSAKCNLVYALLLVMLSKEYSFWSQNTINWIIYCLYKMFMNDRDQRFRYMAASFAIDLCDASEPCPGYWIMPMDRNRITFDEIRIAGRTVLAPLGEPADNLASEDHDLSDQIRKWKGRETDTAPVNVEPTLG